MVVDYPSHVAATCAVSRIGSALGAGLVAFLASAVQRLFVPAHRTVHHALGLELFLVVVLAGVVAVDSAFGAFGQSVPETKDAARSAQLAEVGGGGGVAIEPIWTCADAGEGVVVKELAIPAASLVGAVEGQPDTGDAVGTAVLALVVQHQGNELAIGTVVGAGGLIGPLVVRTGGAVAFAGEAVVVSRFGAGLTAIRTGEAAVVGSFGILADRTPLHAYCPR